MALPKPIIELSDEMNKIIDYSDFSFSNINPIICNEDVVDFETISPLYEITANANISYILPPDLNLGEMALDFNAIDLTAMTYSIFLVEPMSELSTKNISPIVNETSPLTILSHIMGTKESHQFKKHFNINIVPKDQIIFTKDVDQHSELLTQGLIPLIVNDNLQLLPLGQNEEAENEVI